MKQKFIIISIIEVVLTSWHKLFKKHSSATAFKSSVYHKAMASVLILSLSKCPIYDSEYPLILISSNFNVGKFSQIKICSRTSCGHYN